MDYPLPKKWGGPQGGPPGPRGLPLAPLPRNSSNPLKTRSIRPLSTTRLARRRNPHHSRIGGHNRHRQIRVHTHSLIIRTAASPPRFAALIPLWRRRFRLRFPASPPNISTKKMLETPAFRQRGLINAFDQPGKVLVCPYQLAATIREAILPVTKIPSPPPLPSARRLGAAKQ